MEIPVDIPEVPVTPYSPVTQRDLVTDRDQIFTPTSPQISDLVSPLAPTQPSLTSIVTPPEVGIKHIIYVMLKGRSFDQMLGALGGELGLDGANVQRFNTGSNGVPIFQAPSNYSFNQKDFPCDHDATMSQIETSRDMSGFLATCQKEDEKRGIEYYSGRFEELMGFFPADSLPSLHTLARNFTVCDKWFSSVPGDAIWNRFFALTGTSQGRVYMPQDDQSFLPSQPTLFDRLEEADVRWNVYHDGFATSLLLPKQWESEKINKYKPMTKFYQDCKGNASHFPEFSFIEPNYNRNDDQPPHSIMNGQKLIADVFNAVRSNEELWNTSLIVVTYDHHGGFYDHVTPSSTIAPDEHQEEFTFNELGVRVPALLISPFVDKSVDSTLYDHTSLLAYLSAKWSLGPLGDRVASADHFESKLRKVSRKDCISKISGVSQHDAPLLEVLPFTNFQWNVYSLMRKLSDAKPDQFSQFGKECSSWSEFETLFYHVLEQCQRN